MSAVSLIVGLAGALGGFVVGAVAMSAHHWKQRRTADVQTAQAALRARFQARQPQRETPPPPVDIPVIEIRLDCSSCARDDELAGIDGLPPSECRTCFQGGRATNHIPKNPQEKKEC